MLSPVPGKIIYTPHTEVGQMKNLCEKGVRSSCEPENFSRGTVTRESGAHSGSHWDQAFQKAQTILAILKAAAAGQHHQQDPCNSRSRQRQGRSKTERVVVDITDIRWFSPYIYNNFIHGK